MVQKARDVIDAHRESIRMAVAAGVRIAMGTDSGVGPHGSNLRELQLMHEVGMAPADVLLATTSRAAELLRVSDELGTLEAGKRADLVVVDGDPFDFIGLRERIEQVWKDGRLVFTR
jgi:imidazolonepropionase-like amidohydrolase